MKTQIFLLFLLAGTLFGPGTVVAQEPTQVPGRAIVEDAQGSFIFVFDPRLVSSRDVSGLAQGFAQEHGGGVRHVYKHSVLGFSANILAEGAARLADKNPLILYYEPNGVVWAIDRPEVNPNKKPDGSPGNGPGSGDETAPQPPQVTPWGVSRVGGGGANYTGDHQAWIIDSGIDLDHPDLNVGSCANFAKGKGCNDGNGHGTHVAGTVGAINNTMGVIGVAPGVQVNAVRVLNNAGSGTFADVIAGVDHVAGNGSSGDCANMSLGANTTNTTLENAIVATAQQGIQFTLAAGNDGIHADNSTPARANGVNVYTISATDDNDNFASFSNYGNPPVDYAAPGVSILSTYKGGGTATLSGTSMAAPHACGVLLLGSPNTGGTATKNGDIYPIIHR